MISADEARKMTDSINSNSLESEMNAIESMIYEAIECGDNRVYANGSISRLAINQLRQIGYEVNAGSQYNESYFTIEW